MKKRLAIIMALIASSEAAPLIASQCSSDGMTILEVVDRAGENVINDNPTVEDTDGLTELAIAYLRTNQISE